MRFVNTDALFYKNGFTDKCLLAAERDKTEGNQKPFYRSATTPPKYIYIYIEREREREMIDNKAST